jgi:predicted metal-dependent HD superfamily phosphohydrolase
VDLHSRWDGAWQALGATPDASLLGKRLAAHPAEIELALWFYNTPQFVERYEAQARANLARALARL